MIVNPVDAMAMATASLIVPTSTPGTAHTALPTVVPDLPRYQHLHESGKRTLWAVFILMVVASLAFTAMSWTVPVSKRIFHIITTLITIIAALSYFSMATGQGVSYHYIRVREQHSHVPDTTKDVFRQVFWARYVDWSLTTPLILLNLSLLAGMSGAYILMAVVANVIMILTGLFAAFGAEGTPQKWGWYTIACISYLVIIWHFASHGRAEAMAKGRHVGRFFSSIAGFTFVVWTAYPIIWGVSGGSRHMSVDAEIIAYAVLDILAKPVFGIWLLLGHARIPEMKLELGSFWSNGLAREGTLRLGDDDGA